MQSEHGTGNGRVDPESLVVDLRAGRCGRTTLGEQPLANGAVGGLLSGREVFHDAGRGLEIGTHEGRLDYVCVDLRRFPGRVVAGAERRVVGVDSTERDLTASLGEPWWRDADDEEVLLIYEDRFELQLELTPRGRLIYATMMLRPLLADPDQRLAYGVTKPWPPA